MELKVVNGVIKDIPNCKEIVGSKVVEDGKLLDFVVYKNNTINKYQWGLYCGYLAKNIVYVRGLIENLTVQKEDVQFIIPSTKILDKIVKAINNNVRFNIITNDIILFSSVLRYKYNKYYEKINIPTCPFCGEPYPTMSYEGQNVCLECYKEHTQKCSCCKKVFPKYKLINGECSICHSRLFIMQYHDSRAPLVKFYGDNKNNSVPYMGVELEVSAGGKKDSIVQEILPLINTDDDIFMYCEYDSSVIDGFENITQPATLDYHLSLKDKYSAVFDTLRNMGYKSQDTTCCGLHIHVNRAFFGNKFEHIRKLCYIVDAHWDDILTFSRRNAHNGLQYCKSIRTYADNITAYVQKMNFNKAKDAHYACVNLQHDDTIEIRMFKSTLDIDTFFASLYFVQSICNIAKYSDYNDIKRMKFTDILNNHHLRLYWDRVQKGNKEWSLEMRKSS